MSLCLLRFRAVHKDGEVLLLNAPTKEAARRALVVHYRQQWKVLQFRISLELA